MLSSNLSPKIVAGRRCSCPDRYFHSAYRFGTRILAHVYGLLGPCFKTGRMTPCEPTYGGDPTASTGSHSGATSMLEAPHGGHSAARREISPCPAMSAGSPSAVRIPKDPRPPGRHLAPIHVGAERRISARPTDCSTTRARRSRRAGAAIVGARPILPQQSRFHTLTLQRSQARLTLFSKYFAPFPHGTCSLSVSSQY